MGVPDDYADELAALSDLLHIWLLHDVRFIVTPRSLTDAKKPNANFSARRGPSVQALADALAYQCGDWTVEPPSTVEKPRLGQESGLADSADRDLVLEAQAAAAHVFLTRDAALIDGVKLSCPQVRVTRPSALAGLLVQAGVVTVGGETCGAPRTVPTWAFSLRRTWASGTPCSQSSSDRTPNGTGSNVYR